MCTRQRAMLIMRRKRTTHKQRKWVGNSHLWRPWRHSLFPLSYLLPASQPASWQVATVPLPRPLPPCITFPGTLPPRHVTNLLQSLLLLIPILIAAAMRFMCALMILTLMMRLPIVSPVTHKRQTGIPKILPTAQNSHQARKGATQIAVYCAVLKTLALSKIWHEFELTCTVLNSNE